MSGEAKRIALSWAALFIGSFAWFGSQQYGSNLAFAACPSSTPLAQLLLGLVALAIVFGGGLLSWRVWRGGTVEEPHPFIAIVGVMTSGLLCVAIILQTAASLIIPRCFA